MNRIKIAISIFIISLIPVCGWTIFNQSLQIENLNKQIELLECYKENYLIMADSIQNIHSRCFTIGER